MKSLQTTARTSAKKLQLKPFKPLLTGLAVAVVLVASHPATTVHSDAPLLLVKSESTPINYEQVGWLQWLRGNSRSTRFHFLDLLELLTNKQEQSDQTQDNSPRSML